MPVHRLFAYLITRLFLKDLIVRGVQAQVDDMSSIAPNFGEVLQTFIDVDSAQVMFNDVLTHFAVNMGYVAEITCGKWVYKGEQFKMIANIYRSRYTEMYLTGIAIY